MCESNWQLLNGQVPDVLARVVSAKAMTNNKEREDVRSTLCKSLVC